MSKSQKQKKKIKLQKKHNQAPQKKKTRKHKSAGLISSTSTDLSFSRKELSKTSQYPIHECLIGDTWKEQGLAPVWITRKSPLYFIVGTYLVDTRCLGLKNTYFTIFKTNQEYEEFKQEINNRNFGMFELKKCSYELANSIIYGAINYARQFDFSPHEDFSDTKHILGDPIEVPELIQFGGEDGKPYFINGPEDDVETILQKLTAAVGPEGFHFTIQRPPEE